MVLALNNKKRTECNINKTHFYAAVKFAFTLHFENMFYIMTIHVLYKASRTNTRCSSDMTAVFMQIPLEQFIVCFWICETAQANLVIYHVCTHLS